VRPYCFENQLNCCVVRNVDDDDNDDNDDGNNNNNNNNCDAEDPAQDFYFVNACNYKLTSLTLEREYIIINNKLMII
jgi:hypothetical protein